MGHAIDWICEQSDSCNRLRGEIISTKWKELNNDRNGRAIRFLQGVSCSCTSLRYHLRLRCCTRIATVFDLRGRFTRELIYTYKKASAHRAKCIMYNSNCFATKLTVIALLRVAGTNVHSNYKILRTNRWFCLLLRS